MSTYQPGRMKRPGADPHDRAGCLVGFLMLTVEDAQAESWSLPSSMRTPHNRAAIARNILACAATGERGPVRLGLAGLTMAASPYRESAHPTRTYNHPRTAVLPPSFRQTGIALPRTDKNRRDNLCLTRKARHSWIWSGRPPKGQRPGGPRAIRMPDPIRALIDGPRSCRSILLPTASVRGRWRAAGHR